MMTFKTPLTQNLDPILRLAVSTAASNHSFPCPENELALFIQRKEVVNLAYEFFDRLAEQWRNTSVGSETPTPSEILAAPPSYVEANMISALESDVAGEAPTDTHESGCAPSPEVSLPSAGTPRPTIQFKLPPAKESALYQASPEVTPDGVALVIVNAYFPDEFELKFDSVNQEIVGTPVKNGEISIEFEYRFADEADTVETRFAATTLVIHPDPRKLWLDVKSDDTVPFWKPDSDSKIVPGDSTLVAASKRGRSHAHKGTCRDDDFWIEAVDGWSIAVLADGAGSALYSRKGAQLAVNAAGTFIAEYIREKATTVSDENKDLTDAMILTLKSQVQEMVGHAALTAFKALTEVVGTTVAEKPLLLSDLNTTLLIAVSRRLKDKTLIGTYTIGDGAVAILSGEQRVEMGGKPDSGEFAGGTRFLGSKFVTDELWERTKIFHLPDVRQILLMTDGVSDPKFKSDNALLDRTAWDELLVEISKATGFPNQVQDLNERLLDWLDFFVQGEHDDRTIAMIW